MQREIQKTSILPWLAAIAFFMQTLDTTILNTAIPSIALSLQTSPLGMQSAIVSYALTVALLIPISGWLADRFGTRNIFITAISLFSLGSLLCALSNTLIQLVVFRVVQGVGGAIMMPVARLVILRAYPRSQLLPTMNFIATAGLIGPVLGPLLGGFLVSYISWHWIFLINIPIGCVGIFFAYKSMPNFVMPRKEFDALGFILFSSGLVLLSGSLVLISEALVRLQYALLIVVMGVILLGGYVKHALNYPDPLIILSVFKIRTFSIGIIGSIASRLGISSIPFLMPLMLQIGFGHSAFSAGLMMAPFALGSIFAKSFVVKLLRHLGYRTTLMGITVLMGIMMLIFSLKIGPDMLYAMILPLFIVGIFMSIHFSAMNTLTLGDLTNDNASSGNSLMAVTQQISISLGISASTLVLHGFIRHSEGSTLEHFHSTFMVMGLITIASMLVFSRLKKTDGDNLIRTQK